MKSKEIEKKFLMERYLNETQATAGKHSLVLVLDHLKESFNIGKIFRMSEIFSLQEIHLIGTKRFNPYPAKGAFKRVPCFFFDDINQSLNQLLEQNYALFSFDLKAKACLHEASLPIKSAFLFGHEEFGVQLKKSTMASHITPLKIPQFGMTQSLNVSIAASIASYEYLRQNVLS